MIIINPKTKLTIGSGHTAGYVGTAPLYQNGSRDILLFGSVKFEYAVDASPSHSSYFYCILGATNPPGTMLGDVGQLLSEATTVLKIFKYTFAFVIPKNYYYKLIYATTGGGITPTLEYINQVEL